MRTMRGVGIVLWSVVGAAACSSSPPPEAPAPVPPAEAPPPPPLPMIAPAAAAGSYQLRVTLQSTGQGQQGQGQRRGQRPPAATTLRLDNQVAAVPMMGPSSQFSAIIHVPGYTRPPRGRTGQAAAWWPSPGDSVIVQFAPVQPGVQIQLRGALTRTDQRTDLSGEIWYLSLESGSTFQLGTFTATKSPPPQRGR